MSTTPTPPTFGQIIADARTRAGLSPQELAARLFSEEGMPISARHVNEIEHDQRTADSNSFIDALARQLSLDPGYLLSLSDRSADILLGDSTSNSARQVGPTYSTKDLANHFIHANDFVLTITSKQGRTWQGERLDVSFEFKNQTNQPVSGTFLGKVIKGDPDEEYSPSAGIVRSFLSLRITNLLPQTSYYGQLSFGVNRHGEVIHPVLPVDPSIAGLGTIIIQFWAEVECDDADADICIVHPSLNLQEDGDINSGETQLVETLALRALDWAPIELYPQCEPAGPDYLTITSLTASPDTVELTADGQSINYRQADVVLQWRVEGGGFRGYGTHPGSVSEVILRQGKEGAPGSLVATGRAANDTYGVHVAGRNRAFLAEPFMLLARGNCGWRTASLHLKTKLPPPKIVSFKGDPPSSGTNSPYSKPGEPVTFHWDVGDCIIDCNVTLEATYGHDYARLDWKVGDLPAVGAHRFVPTFALGHTPTKYILTASSAGGQDRSEVLGYFDVSGRTPTLQRYWFKLTLPGSIRDCFVVDCYAADEKTAKAVVEFNNQQYKVELIPESQQATACS